jgi:hypothetical protein
MPKPVPHDLNVDGPFYVEDGCCLLCDVPRSIAPEMFTYTEDKSHCFIYRQPESPEDFDKMIEVLKTQELLCIRCRSRDRSLLKRLKKEGLENLCD